MSGAPYRSHPSPLTKYSREDVFDPWRCVDTTTETRPLHQGGHGVSHWVGKKRSDPGFPTMWTPPEPPSPTQTHPQNGDVSDLSATPLSSLGPFQRLVVTPSRSLGYLHPRLTPLGPPPNPLPVPTPSNLSPHQHHESSGAAKTSSPLRDQHTMRTSLVVSRPNKHSSQTRSANASDERRVGPSSRGLPALPPSLRHNTQAIPSTPSPATPTNHRPSGRGLNPRLATITPRDSKLTPDRKFHLETF